MFIDLSSQKLPPIFIRNGKKCYLDPVRKKLIYITPEETVRQQVISYVMKVLGVPIEMISVEEPLSHYGLRSSHRADIIIKAMAENEELFPIAVIECKAPTVGLGDRTAKQMLDYSDALGCDYAMMINDYQYYCYYYDANHNEYIQIEAMPKYEEMLSKGFVKFDAGPFPDRIPHNEISLFLQESLDDSSNDISPKTDHQLACAAFNLWEGLLDPRHRLPKKEYKLFRLMEDHGVRMLSYGNAGGGVFYGPYRSFLIEYNGSAEFVSMGFSTYGSSSDANVSKTVLNVAIDNEKTAHHSLQLVFDDNVLYSGDVFSFYHHGRIGVGRIGSGKISELREFVRAKYPQIISGSRFCMGSLKNDRDWYLDDPDVVNIIENLISYALVRDEYRSYVKNK